MEQMRDGGAPFPGASQECTGMSMAGLGGEGLGKSQSWEEATLWGWVELKQGGSLSSSSSLNLLGGGKCVIFSSECLCPCLWSLPLLLVKIEGRGLGAG